MFKGVIAVMLSLIMLVLPLSAFAVPAASDEAFVEISAGTVFDAEPGGTVSVPVLISSDTGYAAHCLRMSVHYDPAQMTAVSVTSGEVWNSLPDDCMKIRNHTSKPGVVDIAILCPSDPMTETGCLVNINFTLAEDCGDELPIIVEVAEFFLSYLPDSIQENVSFVTVDGAVVTAHQPEIMLGDVNCDGMLNYSDITELYFYMLSVSMLTDEGRLNADFDGDSMITFNDISELYIYLLGA